MNNLPETENCLKIGAVILSKGLGDRVILLRGRHAKLAERSVGEQRGSREEHLVPVLQYSYIGGEAPGFFGKNKGVLKPLRAILAIKHPTNLL